MGTKIKILLLVLVLSGGTVALTSDKVDGPAFKQVYTRLVTRVGHYVRAHMGD